MVMETDAGAYLGPGARLRARARQVLENPNFDVFDAEGRRLLLGKCSRLPDDEDPGNGRYGIDFHRRLPPFQEAAGVTCDWGEGPITGECLRLRPVSTQNVKISRVHR